MFSPEDFEKEHIRYFKHSENPLKLGHSTIEKPTDEKWDKTINRWLSQGWLLIDRKEYLSIKKEGRIFRRMAGLIQEKPGDLVWMINTPHPDILTPEMAVLFKYGRLDNTLNEDNGKKTTHFAGCRVTVSNLKMYPDFDFSYKELMYLIAVNHIGKPKATETMTIEDLERCGYVGIYRLVN